MNSIFRLQPSARLNSSMVYKRSQEKDLTIPEEFFQVTTKPIVSFVMKYWNGSSWIKSNI